MLQDKEFIPGLDVDPRGKYSVNSLRSAINRLARYQDGHFPPLPCAEGCSDCCHELVYIGKAEQHLVRNAFLKLHEEIKAEIRGNALESFDDTCPFLVQAFFGCALHDTGAKPLVCQLAGRMVVNHIDGRTLRHTGKKAALGCLRVPAWWDERVMEARTEFNDPHFDLPIMGKNVFIIASLMSGEGGMPIKDFVLEELG